MSQWVPENYKLCAIMVEGPYATLHWPRLLETDTVNGERFAGLNFCGFHPMKLFTGKLSQCLTFYNT